MVRAPAEDVVSAPDSSIEIVAQFFVDKKHILGTQIVLSRSVTGGGSCQTVSYDVSFKINGGLQWHGSPAISWRRDESRL
jgi:hypothetical protein